MGLLFIGDLNVIAPILTMFFLLTYGLTNVACFVHRISGHPNFRPRYRFFTWHTAFVGGLYCIGVMFYLDWQYSLASLVLVSALAVYIAFYPPEEEVDWGDVTQSLTFHVVRKYLLKLDSQGAHTKFWRPQFMVVMQGGPCGSVPALEFIDSVKKGGLFIIGDTLKIPMQCGGRPPESMILKRDERRQLWLRFLEEAQLKAFIEINMEQEGAPHLGVANLVNAGTGGLKPNTLVMLLPETQPQGDDPEAVQRSSARPLMAQPAPDPRSSLVMMSRTNAAGTSKANRRKLDVTSNSVYEAGAAVLVDSFIVVIINHCYYR
jgi:potassium/chloride transporter 9